MRASSATPPLRLYQKAGIGWLVERLGQHRAVLLADDPGLGKTLQALAAADQLNAERILIICPAGARRVWYLEILKWFPQWEPWIAIIEPGTPAWRDNPLRPAILIVGYDTLSDRTNKLREQLSHGLQWDLLVLDEAHYLKNPSNRTQAVYGHRGEGTGIQARAKRVVLLSGTPTPNHAGEMYEHCRTFWPATARRGRDAFEETYTRYKDTVFGRQVVGSKNQAKLRDALKDVVLRRRKSEVLTELPPLVLQDIPLAPVELPSEARQLGFAVSNLIDDDDELLRVLNIMPKTTIAGVRQNLGISKAGPAIEWVQERMQSTEKMLVFAWHHSVINLLQRGLLEFEPAVITGETGPKARAEAVDKFQNRPATRIFLGQILAAGTAITLTAASEVAIVEPSWVPGENVQAICRAHRIGQRDSVLASFLYLPGTLDERIMAVFRRKASEISQLQGDDNGSDDQVRHKHARGAHLA